MPLERNDVDAPLWRKKVDGSLLTAYLTPIPGWVSRMWSIPECFPNPGDKGDPQSAAQIRFQDEEFKGAVVAYQPAGSSGPKYRLFFEEKLGIELAETFPMSNMRDLESRLRKADGDDTDVEQDIPFWEFLDVDFDKASKRFNFVAHYRQKPSFPSLFARLSKAPPLKRMRDELAGKDKPRIYKQPWKPRSELETEIGATNVIYMLIDTKDGLFYVGEAEHLIGRLKAPREIIPSWDFYRYDMLPAVLAPFRVQLEWMLISDIDSLFGDVAQSLPVRVSHLRLVNLKKDR